jgi:hypothetical protein
MNLEAPHILGTIKLHKEGRPIRTPVNWKNSPGYKLATHLARQLKNTIQLLNAFNIQNSENLYTILRKSTWKQTQKYVPLTLKTCTQIFLKMI